MSSKFKILKEIETYKNVGDFNRLYCTKLFDLNIYKKLIYDKQFIYFSWYLLETFIIRSYFRTHYITYKS